MKINQQQSKTNKLKNERGKIMKYVGKFEKVSFKQFKEDFIKTIFNNDINIFNNTCGNEKLTTIYEEIKLPVRATKGSAGYDFASTIPFNLHSGESILIPTGIRVRMDEDFGLFVFPRSGLGCKYRLQFDNSIPLVDSDYYYSNNEGHILFKMTNDSKSDKVVNISCGDRIAQGVFLQYGITVDDECINVRNGGFGSSGNN